MQKGLFNSFRIFKKDFVTGESNNQEAPHLNDADIQTISIISRLCRVQITFDTDTKSQSRVPKALHCLNLQYYQWFHLTKCHDVVDNVLLYSTNKAMKKHILYLVQSTFWIGMDRSISSGAYAYFKTILPKFSISQHSNSTTHQIFDT